MTEAIKIENIAPCDFMLLYDLADDKSVEIIRTGTFYSRRYGKFSITEKTLDEIEANFESGRICADYNHGSLEKNPESAKAAGWVQTLERKTFTDRVSLMATVDWTDDAKTAIEKGAYKFTSPEFVFNWIDPKDNEPKGAKMLAFALTNRPFLPGMTPLQLYEDGHFGPVIPSIEQRVSEAVALAEESMSQKVERVSRAFYKTFPEGEQNWSSVREIYEDRVIATRYMQRDQKTFEIGYTDDEEIVFDPPENWVEVRTEYVPVKATDATPEKDRPLLDPDLVKLNDLRLELMMLNTPGIRRALQALAKRRRSNLRRVAQGKDPIVKDEKTGKLKKTKPGNLGMNKEMSREQMNTRRRVRSRLKEVERKIAAVDEVLEAIS